MDSVTLDKVNCADTIKSGGAEEDATSAPSETTVEQTDVFQSCSSIECLGFTWLHLA